MKTPGTATSRNCHQFIAETEADKIVANIQAELLRRNEGKPPVFSDLIKTEDGKTYQYANYVQEGGGVLGVGLIGYTYVLEKLGIRFVKLAGTSAGAINTMMLAVVDKDNYKEKEAQMGQPFTCQSELILQEMLDFDLWNLVDGAPVAKKLLNRILKNKTYIKKVLNLLKWLVIIALGALLVLGIGMSFSGLHPTAWEGARWPVFKTLAWTGFGGVVLLAAFILWVRYYLGRFIKAGYGINPGDAFYDWMKDILLRNGIKTTADLEQKMADRSKGLSLSPARLAQQIKDDNAQIDPPYLSIIASDITNQTKVEFPRMTSVYWPDNPHLVHPADFVRASMSIPVFFEPFTVSVPPQRNSVISKTVFKTIDEQVGDAKAIDVRFVDGGILSNFPINLFHNNKVEVARLPTFGCKLEDETHIDPAKAALPGKKTFLSFLGDVFTTVRFYYDREFLMKHEVYQQLIGHVDVEKFNWLNFSIGYEEQKALFVQGAKAAETFFLGGEIWVDGKKQQFAAYDWERFKKDRLNIV